MTKQRERPGGASTGAVKGTSSWISVADLSQAGDRVNSRYWLHVLDDGYEVTFTEQPTDLPTLTVEILNDAVEQTFTKVLYYSDSGEEIRPRPRGSGWIPDCHYDTYTTFRRWRKTRGRS